MFLKNKILTIVFLWLGSSILSSQTYTFTPAGATGRYGPTQTQVNTSYTTTNLNGAVTVSNGIQSWTVPSTGNYKIEAFGAKGGNGQTTTGSSGAKMGGEFSLTLGQVLKICAGQLGGNGYQAGGGGGSFVTDNSNTPLIIAGGSGGASNGNATSYSSVSMQGTTSTSGLPGINPNASVTAGAGGTSGNGGFTSTTYTIGDASAGGGLLSDGADGNPSTGGLAFINGAIGGAGASSTAGIGGDGGFGGGGGGDWSNWTGSGGGGGYSGGGGGVYYGCGGGGGSYNSGTNQINTSGANTGNGYVIFTKLSGVSIIQTTSISCYGMSTAVLTASAFGGTAPYTYSWSPSGSSSATLSGLGIGTYTCRAVDASSVVYTNTFVITQPSQLVATLSQTNVSCFGGSNGVAKMTVSGGASPYSYTWTPTSSFGSSVTGLSAGTYSCLIKDANACSSFTMVTITQPAALSVFGVATTPTVCSGGTSMLLGGGALTYSWSNGVTNALAFIPATTTNYTLTGTDAAGCTATAVTGIVVNVSPTLAIAGSNTVCSGNSLTLTVSGANSYTWNSSSNTTTLSVSPTLTASYSVTGANSNGCQNTAVKTVSVINSTVVNALASSPAICIGNTVSLYGSGASTYTWTGSILNNVSFTPTSTASYTVTGTGACGTASAAITVTVNSLPIVFANASNTLICSGATLTLFGSGANTYAWSGGAINNSAFPLTTNTTYTVTGTDANGCQNTATKNISINPLPVVTAGVSASVVCAGSPVTFNGVGANSYSWSGGVTNNAPFSPTTSASYVVTGTDLNGCQNTATTSVNVIIVPLVTANTTSTAVCPGNTVSLYGGGAFSYTWSNGILNNVSFTPTITTTYTVTGANSCFTASNVITVTVNALPVITANATSSVVCLGNTTALFGSGGISYSWSGGISNNTPFPPTASASYTVTGTGANGCQNTAVRSMTVNALPLVTASASSSVFCFGNSTTLNGGGALTYSWTGTITNNISFTPGITTTYTVTGTDANGCQNTAVKTITVNQLPVVTASASSTVICSGATLTLNGTGANTYIWSGAVLNGQAFSPTSTSAYTVTGTNTVTGCTNTAVQNITVNPLPSLTISTTNSVVCNGHSVTLNASGATLYSWTNGVVNNVPFFPSSTLNYSVSGTNTLTGCSKTATQQILVNPLPVVSIIASGSSICSGNFVTLNGQGATTYAWTNGVLNGTAFSPTITSAYSVTGTNTLTGCTSTNSAVQTITVLSLPSLSVSASASISCVNETVILNVSGAQSYSWSTNENTYSISISPSVTTSYTVSGTSVNGCSATTTLTQNVSECLGVETLKEKNPELIIFPNPNNGQFTLSTNQEMEVALMNELGQVLKTISLNETNKKSFLVADLPNGIYFVLGLKENPSVKLKIVVSK